MLFNFVASGAFALSEEARDNIARTSINHRQGVSCHFPWVPRSTTENHRNQWNATFFKPLKMN